MDIEVPELSKWTISALDEYVGGLSNPSKMPCKSYSISAHTCITGGKLQKIQGSVCFGCYAMKNFYSFKGTQKALYRRHATLDKPFWTLVMSELINRRQDKYPYFRWHDSGDLQSKTHFENILNVARNTPNVKHWIPTREYRIVREWMRENANIPFPTNIAVRMSAHMIGGFAPKFEHPLTVSTVSEDETVFPFAHHCPALKQGNSCGDCRACWDVTVHHVDYHLH